MIYPWHVEDNPVHRLVNPKCHSRRDTAVIPPEQYKHFLAPMTLLA
jgi:hypothetical protein